MRTLMARVGRSIAPIVTCAALVAVFGAGAFAQGAGKAIPLVASDEAAGYVVFPKLLVDTSGVLASSYGYAVDTVVQLTNTDTEAGHGVACWYVPLASACGYTNAPCEVDSDCLTGDTCVYRCESEVDFIAWITPGQPIAWRVSEGLSVFPCSQQPPSQAYVDNRCVATNDQGIVTSSLIPPQGDVFRGELKCIEIDETGAPVARNDLIGSATIYRVGAGVEALVDTAAYNAIGVQAGERVGVPNNQACLGGPALDPNDPSCPAAEYAGCPKVLILNHFFDGAENPVNGDQVKTRITLVPCTERVHQDPAARVSTVAQLLVYNEFEQRFSSSTRVDCYRETALADIDTRPGEADDTFSIFSVGTEGTLTGQTRIRGVEGTELYDGHGLLGVAEEIHRRLESDPNDPNAPPELVFSGADAFNINFTGDRAQRDVLSWPATAEELGLCTTCTVDAECTAPTTCIPCSANCAGQPAMVCAYSTVNTTCQGGGVY